MEAMDETIVEVTGTITLGDGSTSEFSLSNTDGWSQWGAHTARLGRTVALVEAMNQAVYDEADSTIDA